MDQKIALLSLFHFLGQGQPVISDDEMRLLRVFLSHFLEEIMSEEDYWMIVNELENEGYITNNSKKSTWNIGREGSALAQSLGLVLLGETDYERLQRIVENYKQDPKGYPKKVNERLQRIQEEEKSSVAVADQSQIRAVGWKIKITHKYSELYVSHFKLHNKIMRNEEALDKELNDAMKGFMRTHKSPIIKSRDGNVLLLTTWCKVEKISLFNQELRPSHADTVKPKDVPYWNTQIVSMVIESRLQELGYTSVKQGRSFINYTDPQRANTDNMGCFIECDRLNIDYTELSDNHVFVWVESAVSPSKRVLDFLQESERDMTDEVELLDSLEGAKLRTLPYGFETTLKRIVPEVNIETDKVATTKFSFAEYWEKNYGITLAKKIQPILILEGSYDELHYPAEMVYVDRYSLEKVLGKSPNRKPRVENPEQRFKKVQQLFFDLKNLQNPPIDEYVAVDFSQFTPTLKDLHQIDAIKDVVKIRQPMLEFYGGAYGIDPCDIFTYGPVCGQKNLSVTHLIIPDKQSEKTAMPFIQGLNKAFRTNNFGNIRAGKDLVVIPYSIKDDLQNLETKIRNLGSVDSQNGIALAVIPDSNNKLYYSLKRLFPSRTKVPLQAITLSTYNDILHKHFRGFKQLCLKLLIKTLDEGQTIWTLANTAGLSKEKTLFIGIGFSRYPREGKVSKCAAVLHDAHGDRVSWKVFSTLQERTITKQWFDTLLLRVRDVIEREKPSRILFYRKGQMFPQELTAIEKSYINCSWLGGVRTAFVSLFDVGNYRFYMYDTRRKVYHNIPAGCGIILNEKEAFLSTSNYDARDLKQGTVVPIRLKIEIGNEKIVEILQEYHDLTYLNWLAPVTTAKHPLVITIAERFAELTREGVSAENLFYLDL